MKSNLIRILAVTAVFGLAAQAQANTETRVNKEKTTTTYGTGTDNTAYGTGSDTVQTTGAPRVKSTSKITTTQSSSPGVMDQSSGTTQDVEVTRMIREGLNSNNSLSTAAKNVEVITLNNTITLRGKVATETEKQQVASVAQSAGGSRAIHNELTVDTSKR